MYKTTCPNCGHADVLYVISLSLTGWMVLCHDGFQLHGDSTDEKVKCAACKKVFSLSELTEE
jgi:hypothetical protein